MLDHSVERSSFDNDVGLSRRIAECHRRTTAPGDDARFGF
jgi:hypothetical protein